MIGPRAGVLSMLAVVLAASSAGAQVDERLRTRLDPTTASAVQALVDDAARAALPVEPLVLKALEGASKGARGSQIVAAVGRLHSHLVVASAAIGAGSPAADVLAAAGALQAGVDADVLRAIRAARPEGSLSIAFAVLTDLIARGVPVKAASEAVTVLVERGLADEQLVEYRRGVEHAIAAGASPATTVAGHARAGSPPGAPTPAGAPIPKAPPGVRPPGS